MVDLLLVEHEQVTKQTLTDSLSVSVRFQPDDLIAFSNIVMDRSWLGIDLSSIPTPDDPDPIRAALKACLVEQMVTVQAAAWHRLTTLYNAPERVSSSPPAWAIATPPSPTRIWLVRPELSAVSLNNTFLSKNIVAAKNFMHYC